MVTRSGRHESQLAFETLSIEGGLLSPEWLSRVAQLTAGQQAEADYRVPKGLNLRDEIGRYWRIAHAHWKEFTVGLERERAGKGTDVGRAVALSHRFIRSLLREGFGFATLVPVSPRVIDGRTYPVTLAALDGRVPVVIAPAGEGVEVPSAAYGEASRRRSPFGLAQEFLNAADGATWGIVSDGLTLRILRDNSSLTRPAWIETDLGRIFSEDRYADFAALWLLTHESRFGRPTSEAPETSAAECALDVWRAAGLGEGTRARDDLREGFKEALLALGQGFLSHPENLNIRAALQDGSLTRNAYFQQLLRLVYRFIFLLTAEERDLLHPPGTSDDVRAIYAAGYGLKRLRDRSLRRSAHDRFSDIWYATGIVFRGLADGEPKLGLPALSGLFARSQCPVLDAAKLENRALLLAVFRLAWLKQPAGLVRVNWRDMGPEELGSVYESLLELEPQTTQEGRTFTFAHGDETKGNARKTTGSYYTPDSLVQLLLDSALEPVIVDTIAKHPDKPIDALLALSIVDPACGSGHFLLAAARRLAAHVARLRVNGTPSAADYRQALRQVVGRCIYGVDLNPMAVELCKVGLWMEAVEPGLPLTFLNSHIQHGNSLLGTTPELMKEGIPDKAWGPIEGDDKQTASALRKRNKKAAEGQRSLNSFWSQPNDAETRAVARAVTELEDASDASPQELANKESRWDKILGSPEFRHQKFVADAWCAAFVWPKQAGEVADVAPTNEVWRQLRDGKGQASTLTARTVDDLAEQYRFFHWHLQFLQVFAKGGFDVVLGNPPWERVNINQKEWFAARAPEVSAATNVAGRTKQISGLETTAPALWADWAFASRSAEAHTHFVRTSGRYPLCAHGDINSYSLFAELNRSLISAAGAVGCILPSGIATDNSTRHFFGALMEDGTLQSLFEFENEGFFSAGKGHMLRFALVTLGGTGRRTGTADFFFQGQSLRELEDPDRHFTLTSADIELINPNTRTCPIFRVRRDAEITKGIYRRVPVLQRDDLPAEENPWLLGLGRTLHMGDDAALFRIRSELLAAGAILSGNIFRSKEGRFLPLYEAKMVYQLDHRYGDFGTGAGEEREHRLPDIDDAKLQDPDFVPLPFYWVSESEVDVRLERRGWPRQWLMGWRDVTDARASLRTVIACAFPRTATSDKLPLILPKTRPCELLGALSSFVFDYCARQKLGGISLKQFILKQLPIPLPSAFEVSTKWSNPDTVGRWIERRVLELTYTAWDLEPFARDVGYDGPPLRWNPERRFLLSCELDAAFFHWYGLSRDDTAYVLDTFPIVRKNDQKAHGEYRTKRVILEIYDEMADSARSGRPYATRLDPRPADLRVAHSPRVALVVDVGTIPAVVPTLPADREAAILIWAIVHASGGTIRRSDLARAFALRSRPDLLRRLAPPALESTVETWARTVGRRAVVPGLLAATLKTLSDRHGVEMATDAESHSIVRTTKDAPTEAQIDPWYRFEAGLVVQVLSTLPVGRIGPIDATISGDDRALLKDVS